MPFVFMAYRVALLFNILLIGVSPLRGWHVGAGDGFLRDRHGLGGRVVDIVIGRLPRIGKSPRAAQCGFGHPFRPATAVFQFGDRKRAGHPVGVGKA